MIKKQGTIWGGPYFYDRAKGCRTTYSHLYERMHNGENLLFEETPPVELFLGLLKTAEKKEGNVQLLNRIIRAGGFVQYINQLERKL